MYVSSNHSRQHSRLTWTFGLIDQQVARAAPKKENLAQWVSLTLRRALTIQNIEKGFRVTRIWPWDDLAMVAKMGPSEVFHTQVEDATDAVTHLCVEEISMDMSEPENPEAQHFYV